MIESNDEKAIEMAVELLTSRYVRSLRACDIEEVLEMEFDDYCVAMNSTESVIREFCVKKGF